MACHIDFRNLDEGFGGKTYKRKRALQEQGVNEELANAMDMELDGNPIAPPSHKRQAVSSAEDPNKPVSKPVFGMFGRPTYDSVIAGKVSGRSWKHVRTQRASAVNVCKKKSSLDERVRQKQIKKAYQERIRGLKEEIKQNKIEKRLKREEREKKKQENILRTGSKLQKITNPKTLLKISKSKKQRKMLRNIPDVK